MGLDLNKYVKKRRSFLDLIKLHWRIYVRKNKYAYKKLEKKIPEPIIEEKIEPQEQQINQDNSKKYDDLWGCISQVVL